MMKLVFDPVNNIFHAYDGDNCIDHIFNSIGRVISVYYKDDFVHISFHYDYWTLTTSKICRRLHAITYVHAESGMLFDTLCKTYIIKCSDADRVIGEIAILSIDT